MTDLIPVINVRLEARSATSIPHPYAPSLSKLDEFLKEAYRIHSHISSLLSYLRGIRAPYLSTAPPPRSHKAIPSTPSTTQLHLTDADRDAIDTSTTTLLRDVDNAIENLSIAEETRVQTARTVLHKKYATNFITRWAAAANGSGQRVRSPEEEEDHEVLEALAGFRAGVLWYLKRELQIAADRQREMMEIRIERAREKEASVLYMVKNAGLDARFTTNGSVHTGEPTSPAAVAPAPSMRGAYDPAMEEEGKSIETQLTPEQLQLFQEENDVMLRHYEDTLSKVRQAESSLLEISSLQTTLAANLTIQADQISQLVSDASNTAEDVTRGNRELKRASERSSTARLVFWTTVGLCGFLVGWDLVF